MNEVDGTAEVASFIPEEELTSVIVVAPYTYYVGGKTYNMLREYELFSDGTKKAVK